MNYLGIDYGKRYLGVALATGPLAEPLTTLNITKALNSISKLVSEYKVDEIIIGKPDESLGLEFGKFVNSLKIVNCKLKIVDETLSSHDARIALLHTTQKRRKNLEHQASATIILQSWLDYHD